MAAISHIQPRRLNDVHARLNPTAIGELHRPASAAHAAGIIRAAAAAGRGISISGGRHAMGGQQFAAGAFHIDTTAMNRILDFDPAAGEIEVEAGIMWPQLINECRRLQPGEMEPWVIAQKQTGADRMTLGGSVSANIHGRGLAMRPLVDDIIALTIIDARGEVRRISREQEPELFSLVVGGYGLFGVITSIRLRLMRRQTLVRRVIIAEARQLPSLFRQRIEDGFTYGDFQFSVDPESDDFLQRGILSCYRPVEPHGELPTGQRVLSADDWLDMLELAHTDKRRVFDRYTGHYLATDGQIYHSDTAQLAHYLDDYHTQLDQRLDGQRGRGSGGAEHAHGTEIISEYYVPLDSLPAFLAQSARRLRRLDADVIYGTIRLVRRDTDTFLAWAKQDYACTVLNLHTPHTPSGIDRTASAFRALIDLAASMNGSFYLTYHRFATLQQVKACYPQFGEFLRLKRRYDPMNIFDSDWLRHYAALLED